MAPYINYQENSLRWDHTGQENAFNLSGLRDIRSVSKGRGVIYFWYQGERGPGGPSIQFYQSQSNPIEFKVDEPGQVSFRLDDQMIFPPSGVVTLTEDGFIVAPSLSVKTTKEEIVLMFFRSSTAALQVTAEKSSLSVLNNDSTVTLSTNGNEVHCLGTISGASKSAHIVVNRNPNLPLYKDGFNQEIGRTKVPGEVNVTWKPVSREFEERLIVFNGSTPKIRIVDDLLDWMRWSKDVLEYDPGDYVVGDGPEVNYTLRLVLDRGFGRHAADETRLRITRP